MENNLLHNKETVIMYMDQNRKLLHHYNEVYCLSLPNLALDVSLGRTLNGERETTVASIASVDGELVLIVSCTLCQSLPGDLE